MMNFFQKYTGVILLTAGVLALPASSRAERYDQQFSVSLDAVGREAFVPASTDLGIGLAVFGDWRPLPLLSIGTGFDFTEQTGNGTWQASSWNIGARLFPAGTQKSGEIYLQGTVGIDFAGTTWTLNGHQPGNIHLGIGPGYRIFMGEGNALDLGAQYDYYTPVEHSLSAVGIKVGWTFLFGKTPGPDLDKVKKPASPVSLDKLAATPVEAAPGAKKPRRKRALSAGLNQAPAATPTPADSFTDYTWVSGDTLESISEAFLGRGNLFPLILDANHLASPEDLKPGVVIKIPQNVTDAQKEGARAMSDNAVYDAWKKVGKPF